MSRCVESFYHIREPDCRIWAQLLASLGFVGWSSGASWGQWLSLWCQPVTSSHVKLQAAFGMQILEDKNFTGFPFFLFFFFYFLKPVLMASKLKAGQYNRQPGWQLCGKGGRRQQSVSFAAFSWSNGVCCSGPCHPPGCLANELALFCNSGLVCTANGESYGGATHSVKIARASGCRCHWSHGRSWCWAAGRLRVADSGGWLQSELSFWFWKFSEHFTLVTWAVWIAVLSKKLKGIPQRIQGIKFRAE